MGVRFYVDETKAKSYAVVAVSCPESRLAQVRSDLRSLVMPGQRTLHAKDESAPRRRLIADKVARLSAFGVSAIVLDAGRGPDNQVERRGRCLDALMAEALRCAPAHLVLDLDESLMRFDRKRLYRALPGAVRERVTYEHARRSEDQLLALPDTVAWCWARGGEWRRRIAPIISDCRKV